MSPCGSHSLGFVSPDIKHSENLSYWLHRLLRVVVGFFFFKGAPSSSVGGGLQLLVRQPACCIPVHSRCSRLCCAAAEVSVSKGLGERCSAGKRSSWRFCAQRQVQNHRTRSGRGCQIRRALTGPFFPLISVRERESCWWAGGLN